MTVQAVAIVGGHQAQVVKNNIPRFSLCARNMGPWLLFKGSELWAPILKVVYNGIIMAL